MCVYVDMYVHTCGCLCTYVHVWLLKLHNLHVDMCMYAIFILCHIHRTHKLKLNISTSTFNAFSLQKAIVMYTYYVYVSTPGGETYVTFRSDATGTASGFMGLTLDDIEISGCDRSRRSVEKIAVKKPKKCKKLTKKKRKKTCVS